MPLSGPSCHFHVWWVRAGLPPFSAACMCVWVSLRRGEMTRGPSSSIRGHKALTGPDGAHWGPSVTHWHPAFQLSREPSEERGGQRMPLAGTPFTGLPWPPAERLLTCLLRPQHWWVCQRAESMRDMRTIPVPVETPQLGGGRDSTWGPGRMPWANNVRLECSERWKCVTSFITCDSDIMKCSQMGWGWVVNISSMSSSETHMDAKGAGEEISSIFFSMFSHSL